MTKTYLQILPIVIKAMKYYLLRIKEGTRRYHLVTDFILNKGNKLSEKEFFKGEINDLILDSLHIYRKSELIQEDKRIIDIYIAENSYIGIGRELNNEISKIFSGYRLMTDKMQRNLEKIGFQVVHGRKHNKIIYHNDNRYSIVISSTASDFRSGKNICSIISNIIF